MPLPRVLSGILLACTLLLSPAFAQQPSAAPAAPQALPDKAPFDTPYGPAISLERAQSGLNAAVAESKRRNWKMVCAIVDSSANLVAFARMDGAQLASIVVAEHKARASAQYRRDTKWLEEAIMVNKSYTSLTLDGMIASRGGVLIEEQGKIIGAIGCSGGMGVQDEFIAKSGIAAILK